MKITAAIIGMGIGQKHFDAIESSKNSHVKIIRNSIKDVLSLVFKICCSTANPLSRFENCHFSVGLQNRPMLTLTIVYVSSCHHVITSSTDMMT